MTAFVVRDGQFVRVDPECGERWRRLPRIKPHHWVEDKPRRRKCVPGNKGRTFPASPPSPDDMRAILDMTHHPDDDLDFDHCTVTVRRGKGGKRRIVGIDRHALTEINAWLHVRALLGLGLEEPLFCVIEGDQRGAAMNQSYARLKLHEAARRAGVLTRTAPHQLRHGLAVELARDGVPVALISRQLGHSNIATTATYLQGIAPEEVIAVMAGRAW